MIAFDAAHRVVHYPENRRFHVWIRPAILAGVVAVALALVAAPWLQFAVAGLPFVAPPLEVGHVARPQGFPLWLRLCHFLNFFFVMMLIRSGLSILMDHPRLYFNDHCTPGIERIRFTPLEVPRDRLWTG